MPPPRDVKKSTTISDDEKRVLANRYRVEKKLGSGNFGTAFLVTDLKENNQQRVLKEVSVGDMQSDESIESVHEANLLSKLDNPYILRYYDSFLDGEYFCIVTEYCEGGDLDIRFKQLKKENKRLSEEQVLDWTVQLLSAVNYMHSRRVLHRDLKARNIFLKNEIVKIGDFGISRILQGTMDMASTFTGTPYYMSPEVLKHEGYNSKSDVWSIGCLLYEMCTYQHAFEGQGLMGVMYKIVEGKVPELPNTYSKELNNVLKKIFRKDPNSRPSTSELLREPYIANHMKTMIERLKSNKIVDLDSTVMIRNDRNEIAKAVNTKFSLKELQMRSSVQTTQPAEPAAPLKATPIVQATAAAAAAAVSNKKTKAQEHDDDDDVRSGKEEPIKQSVIRPKTSGPAVRLQTPPQPRQAEEPPVKKELTPKEKMLLNKLKKADEEAAKVGQIAKENLQERMLRDTMRREATIYNPSSLPKINPNSSIKSEASVNEQQRIKSAEALPPRTRMVEFQPNPYEYEPPAPPKREYEFAENPSAKAYGVSNNQTLKLVNPNDINNRTQKVIIDNVMYELPPNASDDDNEGTLLHTIQLVNEHVRQQQQHVAGPYHSNIPQPIKINYDSRPIRPMKTKLENAFDEQGIPFDPNVTNEYYRNDDFENDSPSPERKQPPSNHGTFSNTRNSMSRTVAPNRARRGTTAAVMRHGLANKSSSSSSINQLAKKGSTNHLIASKTFSSGNPRSNAATRNEYEQLIDYMQNALSGINNNNNDPSETFGDDVKTSVFGAHARATKVQNLRAQAMRRLGEEKYDRVYSYMREQRKGPNASNVDENKMFENLKQFGVNPSDCFLVDQLLFLEEM